MTEDEKMQVAVFRFSVIGDFVNGSQMTRAQKRHFLQEKCLRKWNIPFSTKTRISKSTIRRIRLYNDGDLKSLYPDSRIDKGKSRSMDEDTCCAIIRLRREMPDATAAHLIAVLTERRLIPDGIELYLSNVYRLLHQNNLMHLTEHKPVNLHVNCSVKRDKNNNPQIHVNNHTKSYRSGKLWSSQRSNQNE